jgi:2-C-methyl-D-erythritol 4-phosphate cytidylyltransferase
VVARHKDRAAETCLILYQDKISKTGFPTAVRNLNDAARLFTETGKYTHILCVACVVDTLDGSSKQHAFEFPYMLVNESSAATFFTPTFEQAVSFLRARHRLAEKQSLATDGASVAVQAEQAVQVASSCAK